MIKSQIFRYALIGILSNAAGYLLYLLLTFFGVMPKLTMTLLYSVSAILGYFGNRRLTFTYEGSVFGSGIRYFLSHFFGYLINLLLLIYFVDQLEYPHQWVQAIAIFIVAAYLFVALKFYVFKGSLS